MAFIGANDAAAILALPITPDSVTIQLVAGQGDRFPSPTYGDMFAITLSDKTNVIKEIVYCFERVGDTLSVMRAQEDTTALSWIVGTKLQNLFTYGTFASLGQSYVAIPQKFSEMNDCTSLVQNLVNGAEGRVVWFPSGVYTMTQLTIPSSVKISGSGYNTVLRQKEGTNSHFIISENDAVVLEFSSLTIDGNQQNQTNNASNNYYGIRFSSEGVINNPAQLIVKNCQFLNGRAIDIAVFAPDSSTVKTYLTVEDSFFLGGCEGSANWGTQYIYYQGTINASVTGNVFDFNALPVGYGRAGVVCDDQGSEGNWTNPSTADISNNEFINIGRCSVDSIGCIDFYTAGSQITINANRLIQPYGRGISVKSDQSGITITSNEVLGLNGTLAQSFLNAQIAIQGSVSTKIGQGISVVGNVCIDSLWDGISVTGRNSTSDVFARNRLIADNVVINPVRRCIGIVDCLNIEVKDNSTYGGSVGLYASPLHDQIVVTGNFFDSPVGVGAQLEGNVDFPSCDVVFNDNYIGNSGGRGLFIRFVGSCTILVNRFVVFGNNPMRVLDVSGTRFIRDNSILSDTDIYITDPSNVGPLFTDQFKISNRSFSLDYPDGTAVGGNARGERAVDLQQIRTLDTQVAAGLDSFAAGRENTASATNSIAMGVGNTAGANSAMVIGVASLATGFNSLVLGFRSSDKARYGFKSYASGRFGTATGDAQIGDAILRAATTTIDPTRMTADGLEASTSNIINLINNSSLLLNIDLVVRDQVTGDVATFRSEGVLISMFGNAVSLTGVPIFTVVFQSPGFASLVPPTISADNINKGIDITVVALGSNSTHWVAGVKIVEVQ